MLSPLHEDDKDKDIKDHLTDLYTTELQQRYVDAKAKVAEFTTTSNLALHLKVHGKLTCRVYSALSSLLFASLSIVKTEELERFILKRSTQLPSFLFNLDDWMRSIKIARNFRNRDRHHLVENFLALKKSSDSVLMEIKNKLFAAYVDLKTSVRKELKQMDKLIKVYCDDIFRLLTLALKKTEREKFEINEKKKILIEELATSYEKNKKLQQDREDDAVAAKALMEDNLKELAKSHAEEITAIQQAHDEEKKRLIEMLNNESECKQLELVKFYDEQNQSLVEQHQSQVRERDEALENEKSTTLKLQKTIKDMEKSYNDLIRSTNARIDFLSIQLQITSNNNTKLVEENEVKSATIQEKETIINTLQQTIKEKDKTHSDLIRSTNARIEFLTVQLETAKGRITDLTSEIEINSNIIKEQQDQIATLQKKTKDMEKSYNDLVRSTNARIEFLSIQVKTSNNNNSKLAFENEMKSAVIENHEQSINQCRLTIKELEKKLSDSIRSTNARIEFLSIQLETTVANNANLTAENEYKKTVIQENETTITTLNQNLKDSNKAHSDLIRSTNARIEFLTVQLETAKGRITDLTSEIEIKSNTIKDQQDQLTAMQKNIKDKEKSYNDLVRSTNARIEFLTVQLDAANSNNANLTAENEYKKTVIQENETTITTLNQNLKDSNKAHSDLIRSTNARIEFLTVQLETANGRITDLTSEIEINSNIIKEQQDQQTAFQKGIKDMEKSYNDLSRSTNARIEFLSIQVKTSNNNNSKLAFENEMKSAVIENHEQSINQCRLTIKELEKKHSDSMRSTNARIEFLSIQLETTKRKLEDLLTENNEKTAKISEHETTITSFNQNLKDSNKAHSDLIRSTNARIEFLTVQLTMATERSKDQQDQLTAMQKNIKDKEKSYNDLVRSTNARIEFLTMQLDAAKNISSVSTTAINSDTNKEQQDQIATLQKNIKDMQKSYNDLVRSTNARIEFLTVQLEAAKNTSSVSTTAINSDTNKEQQDQIAALQKNIKDMEKSYNDLVRSTNARIEFLTVQLEAANSNNSKLVEENEIKLSRVISEADKKYFNAMRSSNARIEFLNIQYETIKTKCDRLLSENATLMDDANKASREKDKKLSDSIRSSNARIEFLSIQLEATKRNLHDLLTENNEKTAKINEHEMTIKNLKMPVNDIIRSTNARIEFLTVQLAIATGKSKEQQDQVTTFQKNIKDMEKSYNELVRSTNARIEFLTVQLLAAKNISSVPTTAINSDTNNEQQDQLTALQKNIKDMEKSYNDLVRSTNARIEFLTVQLEAAKNTSSVSTTAINSDTNKEQQDQIATLQKNIKDMEKSYNDLVRSTNARIEFLTVQLEAAKNISSVSTTTINNDTNSEQQDQLTALQKTINDMNKKHSDFIRSSNARIEFLSTQNTILTNEINTLKSSPTVQGNSSSHLAVSSDSEIDLLGMKQSEELLELKKRRHMEQTDNESTVTLLHNEIAMFKKVQLDSQTGHEAAIALLQAENESLTKQLQLTEDKVKQQQLQLESERKEAIDNAEKLQMKYEETHTALESEIQHVDEIRDLIDVERRKLKKKQKHIAGLLLTISNMAQDQDKLQRSLTSQARAQEFSNSILLSDSSSSSFSEKHNNGVVQFQAVVRGYMARSKYYKRRTREAASRAGILYALDKTEQGETGWYSAPDGSVFYFVAENGEYLLACGPLSNSEYEKLLKKSDDINSKHEAKLIKCELGLSIKDTGDNSDVYISSKSKKLFMVCPLDGRFFPPEEEEEDDDEGEGNQAKDKPKEPSNEETKE